jgi:HEAT repeat protein
VPSATVTHIWLIFWDLLTRIVPSDRSKIGCALHLGIAVSDRFDYPWPKVIATALLIFWLWIPVSWAQESIITPPPESEVAPLIDRLGNRDPRIRHEAIDGLLEIGSPAVPALITALASNEVTLRLNAASVLGDLGAESAPAVSALTRAIQDPDDRVRLYATWALGNIGPSAKSAVPALILALQDRSQYVRIYAPSALRRIGVDAKIGLSALIVALGDENARVRYNSANALGAMGMDAVTAIPDLIKLLDDGEIYVKFGTVRALGNIAGAFQDRATKLNRDELTSAIDTFTPILKLLQDRQSQYTPTEIARIRRPLSALEVEKDNRWSDRAIGWLLAHKILFGVVLYLTLLPTIWLLILQFTPLLLLKINNALKPYTDFSLPLISINVPLRYVLFVGFWHYHPRVLDAWVSKYIDTARSQFNRRETVIQRNCYIPIPTIVDGKSIAELTAGDLQPIFSQQRNRIVISGEGGSGKTTLACQIAQWGMSELPIDRLCKHRMLPILLETEFRPAEGKSALLEAVRGQLQVAIDLPEPICQELLDKLLRQRRILVIVDRFSELDEPSRAAIQPDNPDFPINALIITSRQTAILGKVNRTSIEPLRLASNKLSSFMEAYLMQRGLRDKLTDNQFFDLCTRLSAMVGSGQITVLLAKLYAEQFLSIGQNPTNLPMNVPSLMLGYINELNRDIVTEKLNDRAVHRLTKIVAWECLQPDYKPTSGDRDKIIHLIANAGFDDPESCLNYLEKRLYLIQTIGTSQQQIRFSLDPLAEYLAGLNAVDLWGADNQLWQDAIDAIPPTQLPLINGFISALHDCYLAEIPTAQSNDAIATRLTL